MKTSNKLLIGLILAIFLLATIFIGLVSYYQIPKDATLEESTSNSYHQLDSNPAALVYFPVALLLPILK